MPRASGGLPPVGSRVGPYILESPLGAGGMGAVYRARHVESGASHALKVVRPDLLGADDAAVFERFRREAEALARVGAHPGVVGIRGHGVEEGMPWIAMDLIEGGDRLSRRLRAGPLPVRAAARLVRRVAEAVVHLHRHGIVHRDLKPDNVLIDARGEPVLIDFGLVFDALGARLTRTGEMLGTPGFMAPEQLVPGRGPRGATDVDASTDVYGLGALLYACLTARPPFGGADSTSVMVDVVEVAAEAPSRRNPTVPRWLDALCLSALAKDPRARPRSAEAIADALARPPRPSRRVATAPGGDERFRRTGARGAIVALATIAGALAVAGGAIAWVVVAGETPPTASTNGPAAKRAERPSAADRLIAETGGAAAVSAALERARDIDRATAGTPDARRAAVEAHRAELEGILDTVLAASDPQPRRWPPTLVPVAESRLVEAIAAGDIARAERLLAFVAKTPDEPLRPSPEELEALGELIDRLESVKPEEREQGLLAAALLERHGTIPWGRARPQWAPLPEWIDARAANELARPDPDAGVLAVLAELRFVATGPGDHTTAAIEPWLEVVLASERLLPLLIAADLCVQLGLDGRAHEASAAAAMADLPERIDWSSVFPRLRMALTVEAVHHRDRPEAEAGCLSSAFGLIGEALGRPASGIVRPDADELLEVRKGLGRLLNGLALARRDELLSALIRGLERAEGETDDAERREGLGACRAERARVRRRLGIAD